MATAMWSVISFRSVKNCLELEEAHSSSSTNITQAQLDWDKKAIQSDTHVGPSN